MSGLRRYSAILRLFTQEHPDWTVLELSAALSIPSSTVYRTVRELAAEGFIEASADARYRLGSAFVEFDRMMRLTDPLVRTGGPLLPDIVRAVNLPCVCVLARLYGNRVICSVDERSDGGTIATSYERGRPMPLVRGATSKAILATVPNRRLKTLMNEDGSDLSDDDARQLLRQLQDIRRSGYCVTRGEVDPSLVGIAVPVANRTLAISASITLILRGDVLKQSVELRLILMLVSSAKVISDALESIAGERDMAGDADEAQSTLPA